MPFLHVPLLEYTPRIHPSLKTRGNVAKYLLRKAMENELPGFIAKRAKLGVKVPVDLWVQQRFDDIAELARKCAKERELFKNDAIERLTERARRQGGQIPARQLLTLAATEVWYQLYIDPADWRPSPPGPLSDFG